MVKINLLAYDAILFTKLFFNASLSILMTDLSMTIYELKCQKRNYDFSITKPWYGFQQKAAKVLGRRY